ncbi:hypothetical protein F5B20DRAFT_279626 [Whalleya microplaca]|nr:hypothetical protein F5B20DRAFT_279626 [Whalleya microplaca]
MNPASKDSAGDGHSAGKPGSAPTRNLVFIGLAKNAMRDAMELSSRQDPELNSGVTIDLSRRNIEEVPDEFVDIIKDDLERLALSYNKIQSLPLRFAECACLRYLNIRGNRITIFPPALCSIKSLEILDLARNKITTLPPEIVQLASLKVLSIENNMVAELPLCISEMDELQIMLLEGNPLIFPTQELIRSARATFQRGRSGQNDSKFLSEQVELEVHVLVEIKNCFREILHMPLQTKSPADRTSILESILSDSGYGSDAFQISSSLYSRGSTQESDSATYRADDNRTRFSGTSTLKLPNEDNNVFNLASELFSYVQSTKPDMATLHRVCDILPRLIRAFALKIGYEAPTQLHRDVMVFAYRNQRQIATCFNALVAQITGPEEKALSSTENPFDAGMGPLEKMDYWYSRDQGTDSDEDVPELHEDDKWHDNRDEVDDFVTEMLKGFLQRSPAYEWLLATLKRESVLTFPSRNLMTSIREYILQSLPETEVISRTASSQEVKAVFGLDWDPFSFIREQSYTCRPGVAIRRAITLTGVEDNAQALPCERYLVQTWPTSGMYTMDLVYSIVEKLDEGIISHSVLRPDGTKINATVEPSAVMANIFVEVIGTADSVGEVGEQLAWLITSLRSSPHDKGSTICSPSIKIQEDIKGKHTAKDTSVRYEINASFSDPVKPVSYPTGQCWHSMFCNPVIVAGYPIRKKTEQNSGLEIPLNMMSQLAGAKYVNEFDGSIFLKGFSAMLVAVKISRDFVFWHYVYNERGERISYLDYSAQDEHNVRLSQLESSRHVVGWTQSAMYYAGASDAKLDVSRSGLPPPYTGCLLEKVSISAGRIVGGGMSFAVGIRDVPVHISRNGYIQKLKWIFKKYVVFWDEQEKRGWLVNGTSALLHIVRASLESDREDEFSASCLFQPNEMKEAYQKYKTYSAIQVLTNPKNMGLKIYPEKDESYVEQATDQDSSFTELSKRRSTYYRFQDRVEHNYNMLEQMIDHQSKAVGQNGVKVKLRMRKHLEGWDFKDLVTECDPRPLVATLHAYGYGWFDFIRSIQAIVLFGRGFGEVIRPFRNTDVCSLWREVPRGKYYLTTAVADLKKNNRYVRQLHNASHSSLPGACLASC